MTRATYQARKRLRALEQARQDLERARLDRADPWRIQELELRERRLYDAAVQAEDEYDDRLGPAPRGPAPKWEPER